MKTLKSLGAGLLMVLSFSAFATDGSKSEKLDMNYAAKAYIDAIAHGKINGLPEVLDKEIKFTTTHREKIVNHDKAALLKSLEGIKNVEQDCTTQYSVVEATPTLSIVKVVMNYGDFSRITYLSLANTTKGWKITNVSTSIV